MDGARESLTNLIKTTVESCVLENRKVFDDLASIKVEVNNLKDIQHRQTTSFNERLHFVSVELSQSRNELTSTNQVQQAIKGLGPQVSYLQNLVTGLSSQVDHSVSATDYANDIAALRAETTDLRRLLSNVLSNNNDQERKFPSRELDILTSSIAKIGNRANHVESLEMELEILKGRMERLEADHQTAVRQNPPQSSGAEDTSPGISRSPASQKRTASEAGLPETDIVTKEFTAFARRTRSARTHPSTFVKRRVTWNTLRERRQSPRLRIPKVSSTSEEPDQGRSK